MFPSKQIHLQFSSENFHRFWTRKESQGAFTVHSSRFLAKGASSQLRKMKALWLSWDRNFRRSSCFFRPKNKNTENENGRPETSEEKKMISVTCDVCSAGKCFTRLHVAFLFTTCQLKTDIVIATSSPPCVSPSPLASQNRWEGSACQRESSCRWNFPFSGGNSTMVMEARKSKICTKTHRFFGHKIKNQIQKKISIPIPNLNYNKSCPLSIWIDLYVTINQAFGRRQLLLSQAFGICHALLRHLNFKRNCNLATYRVDTMILGTHRICRQPFSTAMDYWDMCVFFWFGKTKRLKWPKIKLWSNLLNWSMVNTFLLQAYWFGIEGVIYPCNNLFHWKMSTNQQPKRLTLHQPHC